MIDISGSTRKSPYFEKDVAKFKRANKLISRGSKKSSSNAYAMEVGDRANTSEYVLGDVVGISSEGMRRGRIPADFEEIRLAMESGVHFITDCISDRNRQYNVGEREVCSFLSDNGYVEAMDGYWIPNDLD